MAMECENLPKNYESTREDPEETERDFQDLVQKNIPSWTAVWTTLFQENNEMRKRQHGTVKPIDLQKSIKKKISELVDKEETLVDLYTKAAESAKKKAEEFRDKTAILRQQIEKDKNLIKLFKHVN